MTDWSVVLVTHHARYRARAERLWLVAQLTLHEIETGYGVGSPQMDAAAHALQAAERLRDVVDGRVEP